MQDEGYKRCTECGATKVLSEFHAQGDGKRPACKTCTRERARRWRQANPEKVREQARKQAARRKASGRPRNRKGYNAQWYRDNRERAKVVNAARCAVYRAERLGELIRPYVCATCGAEGPIEAHHEDYAKPLEVVWLCRACHGATRWKHRAA